MSAAEDKRLPFDRDDASAEETLPHILTCTGRGCRQRFLMEAMRTERVDEEMQKSFPRLTSDWIFRFEAYCPLCKRPGMRLLKEEYRKYAVFLKERGNQ